MRSKAVNSSFENMAKYKYLTLTKKCAVQIEFA
jgi:hypothetical protein